MRTATRLLIALVAAAVLLAASAATAQVKLSKKEEAAALSQAARSKFKEGRYSVCAAMYREAFGMDRTQVGYLYSAALCEQKAEHFAAAERDYRTVLGLVTPEDPLAAKTRGHIDEVRSAMIAKQRADAARRKEEAERKRIAAEAERKRRAEAARKAAALKNKQAGTVVQPAKPAWHKTAGWASIAGGVIAAGIGGFLVMDGLSDIESLQKDLDKKDDGGLINGVHRDEALTTQSSANSKQRLGGAVVVIGVGVAAVGAWLIAPPAPPKKPARATLSPTFDRPGFVASFRF